MIDSVESYLKSNNLKPVSYNIEVKSYLDSYGFNPEPDVFVDLMVALIKAHHIEDRVMIQSFDVRPLQHLRKNYPEFKVSYLISKNNKNTLRQNLDKLGYTPDILSPEFDMVTTEMISQSRDLKMLIIPWTIDKEPDMRKFIDLDVDGIITNYPDLLLKLLAEKE